MQKSREYYTRRRLQKSKEWYTRRRQGITGTEISTICGLNKYKTPLEVYLDKLSTDIPDEMPSEAAYWGTTLENIIAKEYSVRTKNKVSIEPEILEHTEHKFMLGSIDRWVNDKEFILECKTINPVDAKKLGAEGSDEILDTWLCQVAWYCAITNSDKADIAVLVGGQKYLQYTYMRNREFEENLINIGLNFWNNHVLKRIPPEPINNSDVLLKYRKAKIDSKIKINPDIHMKVIELKLNKEDIYDLNKKNKILEEDIKSYMKDNDTLVNDSGIILVTWKNQSPRITFDHKRLQAEMPDIYDKYKQKTDSIRVFRINDSQEN